VEMTNRGKTGITELKRVLIPIIVLVSVIIGALLIIKTTQFDADRLSKSNNAETIKIEVGQILPDFKLTSIAGEKISVSTLKSKVILINFWASWCEACMQEMPSLVKLHKTFKDHGFEILAINLDDNPEMMVPRIKKQYYIEFPLFMDPENVLADLFDVHAIPLTIVMNAQRKILFVKKW